MHPRFPWDRQRTARSRSPSPSSPADPQEGAFDRSELQGSNVGQGATHPSRTTKDESPDDDYTWIDDEVSNFFSEGTKRGGSLSSVVSRILCHPSPRRYNYYKCSHRHTRGCPARKEVELLCDPPISRTIYRGEHTCKNPPSSKSGSSICIDSDSRESSLPDDDPTQVELIPFQVEKTRDYCAILNLIPEDYEFEKDTIIQVWLAEEYMTDEDMGQYCFRPLLDSGYVSHAGTNWVTNKERYRTNAGKLKTLPKGKKHNGNIYLKWENGWQNDKMTNCAQFEHVSLVCNDIDATLIFEKLEQFKELRTLLFLHSYGNKVTRVPDHFFQVLTKLQVLDLSRTHIKKLPSSVGCMICLRFLDLSWTLIEWLPDTICSLLELQTLKLRGCSKLRGLPSQLKRLTKLRHLDVDVLRQLATLPKGIGALKELRTLSAFLVGREEGCKINELRDLNKLSGEFCIAMLENMGSGPDEQLDWLNRKEHLNKLELRWTASQLSGTHNNCFEVLRLLEPSKSVKELRIVCYQGSTFPTWVRAPISRRFVSITFFNCEHVLEFPFVEELPYLKHLELVNMNGVKRIERRVSTEKRKYAAFSQLEKLCINGMKSLETWTWVKEDDGDFRSLIEVTVDGCPNLRDFTALSCMPSIKHLEIRECLELTSLSDTKLPDSLEDLVVEDCPGINKKSFQEGGEHWNNIKHVLNICINTEDEDENENEDDEGIGATG